jgi:hypothetical protein
VNRTHYFRAMDLQSIPLPSGPPTNFYLQLPTVSTQVATRGFPITVGPTTRSACENRICLSLGFFSLRFHHRDRPFEFVYSGYSQSRSAYPL